MAKNTGSAADRISPPVIPVHRIEAARESRLAGQLARSRRHQEKQTTQDAAQLEERRAFVWDTTRQLRDDVREELQVLLHGTRSRAAASRQAAWTQGDWTDQEAALADAAEHLIAITPGGDLWRVLTLLALEASGQCVNLGMETPHD